MRPARGSTPTPSRSSTRRLGPGLVLCLSLSLGLGGCASFFTLHAWSVAQDNLRKGEWWYAEVNLREAGVEEEEASRTIARAQLKRGEAIDLENAGIRFGLLGDKEGMARVADALSSRGDAEAAILLYEKAGQPEKAAKQYRVAADRALAAKDWRGAERLLERAGIGAAESARIMAEGAKAAGDPAVAGLWYEKAGDSAESRAQYERAADAAIEARRWIDADRFLSLSGADPEKVTARLLEGAVRSGDLDAAAVFALRSGQFYQGQVAETGRSLRFAAALAGAEPTGGESVLLADGIRVNSLAFSPNGNLIAVGTQTRGVFLYDSRTGSRLTALPYDEPNTISVAFSPDGGSLAMRRVDRSLDLWDLNAKRIVAKLKGGLRSDLLTYARSSAAFSPDGRYLAAGSSDGAIGLYDSRDLSLRSIIPGHKAEVLSLAFSPDGARLASMGSDCVIDLWQVEGGGLLFSVTAPQVRASYVDGYSIAYSPDGSLIAYACDSAAGLIDVAAGKITLELDSRETRDVRALAFSPDGSRLALATRSPIKAQDAVCLAEAPSWAVSERLAEGRSVINAVSFSPDGLLVASGSTDGRVRLERAIDPRELAGYWYGRGGDRVSSRNAYESAAHAAVDSGRWERALSLFRKAGLDDSDALSGVADAALGRGDLEIALSFYRKAGDAEGMERVAFSILGRGDLATAGKLYLELGAVKGMLWIAASHEARGDPGSAAVWYERAGDAESAAAQYRLAAEREASAGRWAEGRALFLKSGLGAAESASAVASIALGKGELKAAGSHYLDAANQAGMASVAAAYEAKGDPANALVWYERAGEKAKLREMRKAAARRELEAGRWIEAEGYLRALGTGQREASAELAAAAFAAGEPWTAAMYALRAGRPELLERALRERHLGLAEACLSSVRAEGVSRLRFEGHGAIACIAPSPDPRRIALAFEDSTLLLWDLARGRIVASAEGGMVPKAMVFAPDGRRVAMRYANEKADRDLWFWDTATGSVEPALRGEGGIVEAMAFSPDGQYVATAGGDWQIALWSASGRARIAEASFADLSYSPGPLSFSEDGSRVAMISGDGVLCSWEVPTLRPLSKAVLERKFPYPRFALAPDLSKVAGLGSSQFAVFEAGTGRVLYSKDTKDVRLYIPLYSPDSSTVAIAGRSGYSAWDGAAETWTKEAATGLDSPERAVVTADGLWAAASSKGDLVLLPIAEPSEAAAFWYSRAGKETASEAQYRIAADTSMKARDWQRALSLLERSGKGMTEAAMIVAEAQIAGGDQGATAAFLRKNGQAELLSGVGRKALQKGEVELAGLLFTEAGDARGMAAVAAAYAEGRKALVAAEWYLKAGDAESAKAQYRLAAEIALAAGEWAEASSLLGKAGIGASARLSLVAAAAFAAGDFATAGANYKAAGDGQGLSRIAGAAFDKGDLGSAGALYAELGDAAGLISVGEAYAARGEALAAAGLFEKAGEEGRAREQYAAAADGALASRKWALAEKLLLEAGFREAEAASKAALAALAAGDLGAAAERYRAAGDPPGLSAVAKAALAAGDLPAAGAYFSEAGDYGGMLAVAEAYVAKGDPAAAASWFAKGGNEAKAEGLYRAQAEAALAAKDYRAAGRAYEGLGDAAGMGRVAQAALDAGQRGVAAEFFVKSGNLAKAEELRRGFARVLRVTRSRDGAGRPSSEELYNIYGELVAYKAFRYDERDGKRLAGTSIFDARTKRELGASVYQDTLADAYSPRERPPMGTYLLLDEDGNIKYSGVEALTVLFTASAPAPAFEYPADAALSSLSYSLYRCVNVVELGFPGAKSGADGVVYVWW